MKKTAFPPAHGGAYLNFPGAPADYLIAVSASSAHRLFEAAMVHVQDRLDWYDRKATELSRRARRIRFWSIFCFVLGTAMPVVFSLIIKWPGKPPGLEKFEFQTWPYTEVGYLLLAVAGAFVVFDQFFDYSGSWIRYRQSQARLEVLVADLRYSWAGLLMQSGGVIPEGPPAAKFVELLRDFVVRVEMTAETETKEWATQFKARMQAFDSNSALKVRLPGEEKPEQQKDAGAKGDGAAKADGKAPAATAEPGKATVTVRLSVAEADKTQELSVSLNDHPLELPAGGNVEVPLETDRQHTFVGRGMRDGQQVQGTLQITPTQDDERKPLLLTLA